MSCGEDRSSRQSGNRAVADVVGSGDVAHRLSGGAALHRLLDLVGRHLRFAPHLHAPRHSAGAAFACAAADQVALKLCEAA
jgi:hypothetical protein